MFTLSDSPVGKTTALSYRIITACHTVIALYFKDRPCGISIEVASWPPSFFIKGHFNTEHLTARTQNCRCRAAYTSVALSLVPREPKAGCKTTNTPSTFCPCPSVRPLWNSTAGCSSLSRMLFSLCAVHIAVMCRQTSLALSCPSLKHFPERYSSYHVPYLRRKSTFNCGLFVGILLVRNAVSALTRLDVGTQQ